MFDSKSDINADLKDARNRTSMSYAAEKGHEAVVKLLLTRDEVAADSQDKYGR